MPSLHAPRPPAIPVSDLVQRLALAPLQSHKLLALHPLLDPEAARRGAPRWIPLADAFAAGTVRVGELPDGARVPHVLVENDGAQAVLVLFGEELRGALQNRVVNASFLVPPHGRVVLDVSCVEMGRWSRRGAASFRSGDVVLSTSLRNAMLKKVSASRARTGRFHADQGEVWKEIERRFEGSGARSDSRAYADYVASRARDLREIADLFRPLDGQVGFVATMGDAIVGAEIVGHPGVFARVFHALLHAYAIDAVDASLVRASGPVAAPRFDAPEPFLAALGAADGTVADSLGHGKDLRLEGEGVCGCALVADDVVVHLTAFPSAAEPA
jgi:hypothetical protein